MSQTISKAWKSVREKRASLQEAFTIAKGSCNIIFLLKLTVPRARPVAAELLSVFDSETSLMKDSTLSSSESSAACTPLRPSITRTQTRLSHLSPWLDELTSPALPSTAAIPGEDSQSPTYGSPNRGRQTVSNLTPTKSWSKKKSLRKSLRSLRGSVGGSISNIKNLFDEARDIPKDPAEFEPDTKVIESTIPHSSPISVPLPSIHSDSASCFRDSVFREVDKLGESTVPQALDKPRECFLTETKKFLEENTQHLLKDFELRAPTTHQSSELSLGSLPGQVFDIEDLTISETSESTADLIPNIDLAKQVSTTNAEIALDKAIQDLNSQKPHGTVSQSDIKAAEDQKLVTMQDHEHRDDPLLGEAIEPVIISAHTMEMVFEPRNGQIVAQNEVMANIGCCQAKSELKELRESLLSLCLPQQQVPENTFLRYPADGEGRSSTTAASDGDAHSNSKAFDSPSDEYSLAETSLINGDIHVYGEYYVVSKTITEFKKRSISLGRPYCDRDLSEVTSKAVTLESELQDYLTKPDTNSIEKELIGKPHHWRWWDSYHSGSMSSQNAHPIWHAAPVSGQGIDFSRCFDENGEWKAIGRCELSKMKRDSEDDFEHSGSMLCRDQYYLEQARNRVLTICTKAELKLLFPDQAELWCDMADDSNDPSNLDGDCYHLGSNDPLLCARWKYIGNLWLRFCDLKHKWYGLLDPSVVKECEPKYYEENPGALQWTRGSSAMQSSDSITGKVSEADPKKTAHPFFGVTTTRELLNRILERQDGIPRASKVDGLERLWLVSGPDNPDGPSRKKFEDLSSSEWDMLWNNDDQLQADWLNERDYSTTHFDEYALFVEEAQRQIEFGGIPLHRLK